MTVRDRLEDAIALWELDRKQAAWILVLIAAAATAKVKFKNLKDGEAFRKFVRENTERIWYGDPSAGLKDITLEFETGKPGGMTLDRLMYKHLRCNLLHEALVSPDIEFSKEVPSGGKIAQTLFVGHKMVIPHSWAINFAIAVAAADGNKVACGDLITQLNEIRSRYWQMEMSRLMNTLEFTSAAA